MGAGLACVIVHRSGAACAQYWLCARITERLPIILKIFTRNTEEIFTRNTESTVDGLGALGSVVEELLC